MDEAAEILLSSLRSSGVSLPSGLSANSSSIKDLSPDALVSVCSESLRLMGDPSVSWLPTSLPDSASRSAADINAAFKLIGYRDVLSFHQFLYPTNEESYKLLRFLVEKLSDSEQNRVASDAIAARKSNKGLVETTGLAAKEVDPHGFLGDVPVPGPVAESADAESFHVECNNLESHFKAEYAEDVLEEERKSKELFASKDYSIKEYGKYVIEHEKTLASLQLEKSKLGHEIESLKDQDKSLKTAIQSKTLEVQGLEADYELLKEAMRMAFDDQHSVEFYMKELNEQAETRSKNIVKLKTRRNVLKGESEGIQEMPEESMPAQKPELQERLVKMKEIEKEIEAIVSEIHRREIEHAELLVELDKLPKNPPRKYYIDRVTEITKNSWKQDADVHQILKEIRQIRLESNSIQERLHRTYAVVEETIFRDTKSDPVGRQVYRLLTSIHDSFEQITEKILATDRAKREAAEQEKKLAAISSRSLDTHKLQQDLDSIRKENDLLERQLRHD